MDFLDPKRRKAHRRRLLITYMVMAVLIVIGTIAVLYLAYGYDIDRKTGTVIQNGIVFVDSKPGGAKVFVNDVEQRGRTDTRLALPAGDYTIRVELSGFRTWERSFNLEGGEIERLVYPFLIPNQFITTDVEQYDTLPTNASQTPDRRWVLVQRPESVYQFDVYDLNSDNPALATTILLPPGILTTPDAQATVEPLEWSTDNRHLILKRTFGQSVEFLLLDRERPASSININATLGINPVVITLKNKRPDQFYYLEAVPGILRVGDTKNRTISAPLQEQVIDYKSYGDDIILYVTQKGLTADTAEFHVLENGKDYVLKSVSAGEKYALDVSRYDGDWFYVVGSAADSTGYVFKNPMPVIKGESRDALSVTLMRLDHPEFASFSANTQFIGMQSGNTLLTLDLEEEHQYRIVLDQAIPSGYKIRWMDGHRYIYTIDGQSFIIDFDGSNMNTLVTSRLPAGPFFDRDYDNVFTFEESKADGAKKAFTMTIIDD